jgi:hypothetical protein
VVDADNLRGTGRGIDIHAESHFLTMSTARF